MKKILLSFCLISLVGCSSVKEEIKGKSVDYMHKEAFAKFEQKEYTSASEIFKEIDTLYPYSSKAEYAKIMNAYCHYLAKNYIDTTRELDIFLRYHAAHRAVPYAMYLRAMCLYNQVSTADRDSQNAKEAKKLFLELKNRFPSSKYIKNIEKKIEQLDDIIAAHEIFIGDYYYEKNNNALSALGRYNYVAGMVPKTKYAAEAYYKIIKCCIQYNLKSEAVSAYKVLQLKHPNTKWLKLANTLINSHQKGDNIK